MILVAAASGAYLALVVLVSRLLLRKVERRLYSR